MRCMQTGSRRAGDPAKAESGGAVALAARPGGGTLEGTGSASPNCRASRGSALRAEAAHNPPLALRQLEDELKP